jgi:hypothetical protein
MREARRAHSARVSTATAVCDGTALSRGAAVHVEYWWGLEIGCATEGALAHRSDSSRLGHTAAGAAARRGTLDGAILCTTTLWGCVPLGYVCRTTIMRATLHVAWHAPCAAVYATCDAVVACSTWHVLCAARQLSVKCNAACNSGRRTRPRLVLPTAACCCAPIASPRCAVNAPARFVARCLARGSSPHPPP